MEHRDGGDIPSTAEQELRDRSQTGIPPSGEPGKPERETPCHTDKCCCTQCLSKAPEACLDHSLPISFPVSSPPCPYSSSVPSSSHPAPASHPRSPSCPSRISVNPTCPAPRQGSPSPASLQSCFRIPSPSLWPSPHTASPQRPHRGPAPPVPRAPCPICRPHAPYPSRRSAPAGPAAPGRSHPLCPAPPLVTANHSARLCRWGRREPIERRVRGAGGGASASRPEAA